MARKRPSIHSDAQFALFVERMKNMHGAAAGAEFDNAVRRLIRTVKDEPPDIGLGESDDLHGNGQSQSGALVSGSSNNESLLIYVLMMLLRTDEPSAAIVSRP